MATYALEPKAQWREILQAIQEGLQDLLTVEGSSRDLAITRTYIGEELPHDDLDGQQKAKLSGRSWDVPIYGDLELRDKEGTVLNQKKKLLLFRFPQLTPRHSFILRGTEFQIMNQLRLKPGVYTRVRNNGEVESFFNLARGGKFRMGLDPKDGRLRLKVGTSKPALYPILQTLGVDESVIRKELGEELFWTNRTEKPDRLRQTEIPKLYKALFRQAPEDFDEAEARIRERFDTSEISPKTTAITLGKAFTKADGELLLTAAKKLVSVQKGLAEPDRRDSVAFKELYGISDIFKERMSGPNRRELQFRIRRRLDPLPGQKVRTNIRDIIQPERIQRIMESQFTASALSRNPEQINPLEMVQNAAAVTFTGEGGVRDRQMITIPMRNIDPSYLGFIDPLHTPEGASIGVTQHLAVATGKKGREMTTPLYNLKKKKFEDKTPTEIQDATIAFPDTFELRDGKATPKNLVRRGNRKLVSAYRKGKHVYVTPEEVDYVLPSPKQMMDWSANLVPFVSSTASPRVLMAARHQEQAVSLKEREAPWVQPTINGVPFVTILGRSSGASYSPSAGTVKAVRKNEIVLRTRKGDVKVPIYRNFHLNGKSFMDSEPTVKAGDKVKKGDVLADSTFTRDGQLALGKNLLVAYLPYRRAATFEDGIVVSEGAARKLTSLHMHRSEIPQGEDRVFNKKKFLSYYPVTYKKSEVDHIAEDGLPTVGTILKKGDAIVLSLRRREITETDAMLGRLKRSLVKPYKDESRTWKEVFDGEVVAVNRDGPDVTILIRTEEPVQVGDKLAGRHGNKGIISRIIPDSEMLRTKSGKIVDIILNPLGIPSRINPSQVLETVMGKVSEKLGRPAKIDNFKYPDNLKMVEEVLESVGLSDTETLYDPSSDLELDDILVGHQYMMKLDHPVRKKFSARSTGAYTADLVPAKRSGESAQSIDPLTFYSIAAHGARANLREMSSLKAEHRPDVWRAVKMGEPLPAVKPTFAFDRFQDLMQTVGARIQRDGKYVRLMPMTDKEIRATARGPITEASMFQAKTMRPERGGLFDPIITGGANGEGWGYVPLAESIPNPIFEKAILSLTGVREVEFRQILEGKSCVKADGEMSVPGKGTRNCLSGGPGIQRLLRSINLKKELKLARTKVKTAREDELDRLNRRIRFLDNFIKNDIDPGELVISSVPVIPPRLRPLYASDDGALIVSDLNKLYRDLLLVNRGLKDMGEIKGVSDGHKSELRRDLYDATKALMGWGTSLSNPNLRGIFQTVRGGSSNKWGYFQQKILRRRQELSGRSTVIPDSAFSVDEIGLPAEMAWKIFKPFGINKLIAGGTPPINAEQLWDTKESIALSKLEEVMEERPIWVNRSPSLHRHSFIPQISKLVPGQAIRINPLITKGMNMDFDGDTAAIHVPVTRQAVDEAWDLLPSKNAFSAAGDMMLEPRHEMQLGLFMLTRSGDDKGRSFDSRVSALSAMEKGDISADEVVSINGSKTTAGRIAVNSVLPVALQRDDLVLDKNNTVQILSDLAKNNPQALPPVLDALKTLGAEAAYRTGFSVSLKSLRGGRKIKDEAVRKAEAVLDSMDPDEREDAIAEVYGRTIKEIESNLKEHASENPFVQMAAAGARGNIGQVRQLIAAPVLVNDAENRTIPYPITKSWSEGLDPTSFWFASFGGRKGLIDRAKRQAEPGALTKSLIATSINLQVSERDCGTTRGRTYMVPSRDVLGRSLASSAGTFAAGEMITDEVMAALERQGIKSARVRTATTCEAAKGVCAKCYGLDETGQLSQSGTPAGIISSQTITEPASQAMLSSFHTSGAAGRDDSVEDNLERIKQMLQFPKVFKGRGAIAYRSGTIDSVKPNPAGGHFISVDGQEHLAPPGRTPAVKKGDEVRLGQMLSTGIADPREILSVLGPQATRNYVADSLYDIYASTGKRIPRRHFETVARAVVNTTRVLQGDPDGIFMEGDVASLDAVTAANVNPPAMNIATLPTIRSVGKALLEDIEEVGGLGKILTDADVSYIRRKLRKVNLRVNRRPVIHQPVLKGIDLAPLTRRDWLSHLAHRNMKKVFEEGVLQGWKSELGGGTLLPAYMTGTLQS